MPWWLGWGASCPNSYLPMALVGGEVQILTWNGRGICMVDSEGRRRMKTAVQRLAAHKHVLRFQEVHGKEGEISDTFRRWLPGWRISVSVCRGDDELQLHTMGGVVTAICPVLADRVQISDVVLAHGRCIFTELAFPKETEPRVGGCGSALHSRAVYIGNIHNYGLKSVHLNGISRHLAHLRDKVQADPISFMAVLVGDFNFRHRGDRDFKVGQPPSVVLPGSLRSANPQSCSSNFQARWEKMLEDWTEISQPYPTHYDHKGHLCTRIDRGFIAYPSNFLIKLQCSSSVIGSPEDYFGDLISDHAPLLFSFGLKPRLCQGAQPIPRHICKSENFKLELQSLVEDMHFEDLAPEKKLICYKSCIREAARRVRDRLFLEDPASDNAIRMTLSSISRAIWFNDVKLARRVFSSSSIARDLLEVRHGRVVCIDFHSFDSLFNEYHSKDLRNNIHTMGRLLSNVSSQNVKKQIKARIQVAKRFLGIYWSKGKRLKLVGLKLPAADNGEAVVFDAEAVQRGLIDFWEPVYQPKAFDAAAARDFLGVYVRRQGHLFEFADAELPDQEAIQGLVQRARDSATGFDGIPYCAYKVVPEFSAGIFGESLGVWSKGSRPPHLQESNKQKVWFLPKGECEDDKVAVTRTPGNLRTVFGSNTDVKHIASCVAEAILPATLKVTPFSQRGFCRGRQLSLNIVDLDTYMRAYNCLACSKDIGSCIGNAPCTALNDFCNAFPTVLHEWLFLVLEVLGVPLHIRRIIQWMYSEITAFSSGFGNAGFLFEVLCGVRTGCPLSSVLFLLCVNPFIHLFEMLSDGPGLSQTRICADDFGSALRRLRSIKTHASIFRLAKKVAGLCLKPSKCVLIFTCFILDDGKAQLVRNWLRDNVPEFAEFIIADSGKYLGWYLGADSIFRSFQAPFRKFRARVVEVAHGGAPATVSIIKYNQYAVSVISYVAQFAAPSLECKVAALDHWAVHKILRIPQNSMSRKLCHSLEEFTIVDPIHLGSYCAAILFRFAQSEKDYLLGLATQTRDLVGCNLSLRDSDEHGLPDSGICGKSILGSLLDAVQLKGSMIEVKVLAQNTNAQQHAWVLSFPRCPFPPRFAGVQAAILDIFKYRDRCSDLSHELACKACVTLGDVIASNIRLPATWFQELREVFIDCKLFLRVCWLKAIAGAWCTTVRLHPGFVLPCIFGCTDCKDELLHYLVCPILWQFPREFLNYSEPSLSIASRLCLVFPSKDKLKALAFVHTLYHSCKNDFVCIGDGGLGASGLSDARMVQRRATEISRSIRHLV